MKKLLIVSILFLLGNKIQAIEVKNYTKHNCECCIEIIAKELQIPDSITIIVVPMSNDAAEYYDGMAIKITDLWYQIALNDHMTRSRLIKVLIHELVHVRDFANGDLENILGTNDYIYKGKIYKRTKENEYSMPFEKEARKVTRELYKPIYRVCKKCFKRYG